MGQFDSDKWDCHAEWWESKGNWYIKIVCVLAKMYTEPLPSLPLQLAVSSHENATPVKLIHNAAGHLNGPARTIGAGVIGYLGKPCCEITHNISIELFYTV